MQSSAHWSRPEVEAIVADYLEMLARELRGEMFNKSEHNRLLRHVLDSRTKAAVERKHQNISAILIELGFPYINGYKPLGNYQDLLREVVEERLDFAFDLEGSLVSLIESNPPDQTVDDLLSITVPAPKPRPDETSSVYETPSPLRHWSKRNYLELEAHNTALGLAGEELVMRYEHERLWRASKRMLAGRIEQVSKSRGDAAGYDVLSYETDGRERLIEVKTTRFGAHTPFFASRNEVETSHMCHESYQLYRLFKFSENPKLFVLPGSLRRTCKLNPVTFSAQVA